MSIATTVFRRPDYQSDTTLFIDQLKAAKPTLEAEQRAGRALLWDKNVDRELRAEFQEGAIAQQPYVYQTEAYLTTWLTTPSKGSP